MGLYSQALAEYQATFPSTQLQVLFYDDLRTDPRALWQDICAFLEIDSSVIPAFEFSYNRSGKPRFPILQNLLRSYRFKRFMRLFIPHRLAIRLKTRVDDINLQRFPDMDSACRAELREYYRQDIQALAKLTKRDLSSWLK